MNVAHLLTCQARQRPDANAIIAAGATITFAELDRQSAQCAAFLRSRGIVAGDHVLVLIPMSIDLYLALIAILRIGAVATFLDPSAGADHINRCCEAVKPTGMIALGKAHLLGLASRSLRRIPHRITVGWPYPFTTRWENWRRCLPLPAITARDGDDAALVTFTSGSTGRPKGAVRSHGLLAAQHASLAKAIELEPGQIDLATLPIFSLANLASGLTSVIPDTDMRRPGAINAKTVLRQIAAQKVQRCVASPAFFARLLESDDAGNSWASLRRIDTGGAPVFPGLLERLARTMPQARVCAVYGSTEAEPIAEIAFADISAEDRSAMLSGGGLLAGRPVADIDLRIAPDCWGQSLSPLTKDEFESARLPPGQIGEIIVHGRHVLRGYLNGVGNEQTKWSIGDQVWHRTGDAGYLDGQGRLWLMGRAQAKIVDDHGTLYPFAVECAASVIDGVARSALIAQDNQRWLAVQRTPDAPPDLQAILLRQLDWAGIEQIRLLRKIPVDKRHNAKIDYPALRQLLLRGGT